MMFLNFDLQKSALRRLAASEHSKDAGLMRKAEAKILFIMCYYVLLGTVVLTLFTYLEEVGSEVYKAIEQHFVCQSKGVQPEMNCGDSPKAQIATLTILSAISTTVAGLLPVVVVAFTLKCSCKTHKK